MTAALIRAARQAQRAAYAPYSNYAVGAALEGGDGRIFVGCNVENASYGVTICAERMAVGAAVVAGCRSFKRLVVTTEADPPAAPCGACRQMLSEFGPDLDVVGVGPRSERHWRLGDLLPEGFGLGSSPRPTR